MADYRHPPDLPAIQRTLRGLIGWRDYLARDLAEMDAAIAREARAYADAMGVKVRPTLAQLRRELIAEAADMDRLASGSGTR